MAKNQVIGRVIALSGITEIPSKDAGKPAIKKRELYMDCTTYDPYTGERSQYENKPLLEFGGDKLIEKLNALNLQAGDVVAVSFFIQGTPYKDQASGKTKVFTAIRTTDIEVVRKKDALLGKIGHLLKGTNASFMHPLIGLFCTKGFLSNPFKGFL